MGYRYALDNPDDFEGLVFVDSNKWDGEWRAKAILDKLDSKRAEDRRIKELAQRSKSFSFVNALPVPFGIVGLWLQYECEKDINIFF